MIHKNVLLGYILVVSVASFFHWWMLVVAVCGFTVIVYDKYLNSQVVKRDQKDNLKVVEIENKLRSLENIVSMQKLGGR